MPQSLLELEAGIDRAWCPTARPHAWATSDVQLGTVLVWRKLLDAPSAQWLDLHSPACTFSKRLENNKIRTLGFKNRGGSYFAQRVQVPHY